MFCINCFNKKTSVINSRGHKKQPQIWRRRNCPNCGFTFTTYENLAIDELLLVEGQSKNSPYNRGKLLVSIIDALRPTGDDMSNTYWLVQTIEEKLIKFQQEHDQWQKISTKLIAELTYDTLLAYNTVAGYTYGTANGLITINQKRRRGRPAF